MILCLDENLPPVVARSLDALGLCGARHIVDLGWKGWRDEDIFGAIAAKGGWFLLTQDKNIRRNPHQRDALHRAGIGAFILTGRANKDPRKVMIFLLEWLPEIVELAQGTTPPFIFGLPDRGNVDRLS